METLSEEQVERLLDPAQCIAGLERAFRDEDLVAANLVAEAMSKR